MSSPNAAASAQNSNRRDGERIPLRTPVLLLVGEHQRLESRSLDLAKGGMAVVTDWNLPLGTLLALKMGLATPNASVRTLVLRARVVNATLAGSVGGFRLGLQFINVDPTSAQVIERWLMR
jgi:c-di-GMP-binding flagellar brake protein YcgR